jgi:holliday junction DNA helicase RuvA
MISFVSGTLFSKSATSAVIETNGVGLELFIPLSTFEALCDVGESVQLLTYLHVREDALVLFGFATTGERELFRDLLSVSGIGPKLALGIVSGSPISEIYSHIGSGNESALLSIKGLGKKTAQRLIIDLKDKAASKQGQFKSVTTAQGAVENSIVEEALLALISLGYTKSEAEKTLNKALKENPNIKSVEEVIRSALSG